MSLTNYSGLLARAARTLRRDDLTADVPDFVVLFEAQANRELKTLSQMGRTTLPISAEYTDYPADFNGVVTLDLATSPVTRLKYIGPDSLTDLTATRYPSPAKPLYYSVIGSQIRVWPAPDTAYTADLTYTQTIPALSDDNPTNWLLTNHPDAYLYGTLAQTAPFLRQDDRLPMWQALAQKALDDINTNDNWRMLGAQPARRPRSFG